MICDFLFFIFEGGRAENRPKALRCSGDSPRKFVFDWWGAKKHPNALRCSDVSPCELCLIGGGAKRHPNALRCSDVSPRELCLIGGARRDIRTRFAVRMSLRRGCADFCKALQGR